MTNPRAIRRRRSGTADISRCVPWRQISKRELPPSEPAVRISSAYKMSRGASPCVFPFAFISHLHDWLPHIRLCGRLSCQICLFFQSFSLFLPCRSKQVRRHCQRRRRTVPLLPPSRKNFRSEKNAIERFFILPPEPQVNASALQAFPFFRTGVNRRGRKPFQRHPNRRSALYRAVQADSHPPSAGSWQPF